MVVDVAVMEALRAAAEVGVVAAALQYTAQHLMT
jgi:hypothetical protein